MGTLRDKIDGPLKKVGESSTFVVLGQRSDSAEVELIKKAQEKRLCARCLIDSRGLVEIEVEGEFCPECGAKRIPTD